MLDTDVFWCLQSEGWIGFVRLSSIPSPPQGVWHLGPVPIRAYAICIIIGIPVAVFWTRRRWAARGGRADEIIDMCMRAVPVITAAIR